MSGDGLMRCAVCGRWGTDRGLRSGGHRTLREHIHTARLTAEMRDGYVPVVVPGRSRVPTEREGDDTLCRWLHEIGALDDDASSASRWMRWYGRRQVRFVHRTTVKSLLVEAPPTRLARTIHDLLYLTDLVHTHGRPWWAVLGRSQQTVRGTLVHNAFPFGLLPPCPLPRLRPSPNLPGLAVS